jgi:hypothetical protein
MPEKTLKEEDLGQFIGTTRYFKGGVPWQPFLYTEGVQYVAEHGGAYWLLDAIGSCQSNMKIKDNPMLQELQFWTLQVKLDRSAELICESDRGKVVVRQHIDFTDFPLKQIQFYLQNMWCYWQRPSKEQERKVDDYGVLLLPSEY